MMSITLEKVDQVIERTGVSYAEAKEALELSNEDVVDAIIYIENQKKAAKLKSKEEKYETIEDLKNWFKELINKGNVTRIRVTKDGKEIVDVPVNAGIAAGVIGILIPPILAFVVIAAVVTKITIEITKEDGTVEIVNKYITKTMEDIKDTATSVASKVKDKVVDLKDDVMSNIKKDEETLEDNVFSYSVNFDEDEKEEQ
ncbi:MAG: DUF4342 domain-containing protein [Clostridiales bacterium]|uniref:Ubiquitin n=2 Tax=Clostridium isatidis TaxID=182773 RepID=A0A343JDP9_9CLOT|nr:DUF4342 domain-containing protein [Clostridium isatidis]ASW43657.1 ubiquitin [Clostridium isatidis]NLZ34019.1 DUF4342 domain-containing protein [Clostridiales bacterium]